MRVSLLLLLLLSAGCFAKQPPPPFEIKGQSMFVVVETDEGSDQFWVLPVPVNEGEVDFPTILLDGQHRIAVYFFNCSLKDLGKSANVAMIRSGQPPRDHPQPIRAYSSALKDGAFEEWTENAPLWVDLGITYVCPTHRQAWVLGPDSTPPFRFDVDVDSLWVLAEGDEWLIGSAQGSFYRIDSNGQPTVSSNVPALDMTKVGDDFYGLIVGERDRVTTRKGTSPTALTNTIVEALNPMGTLQLAAHETAGRIELALASALGLSKVADSNWSAPTRFCTSSCQEAPSGDILLIDSPERGFIGALSTRACAGREGQLPELPLDLLPDTVCPTITGLEWRGERDIVASVGGTVYVLEGEEWKFIRDGVDHTRIAVAAGHFITTVDRHLAHVFEGGFTCVDENLPLFNPEVKAIVPDGDRTLIVFAASDEVQVQLLVEATPLNTCAE